MPDTKSDLRPIQVFLDTRRFIELEEPQPFGGGSKDFFKDNDRGFAAHKAQIKQRVQSVSRKAYHGALGSRADSSRFNNVKRRLRKATVRSVVSLRNPTSLHWLEPRNVGELLFPGISPSGAGSIGEYHRIQS